MSAALFSHLKVSKALSVSFSVVLYRIHTLCCIFSPSKSAHFVPAILEQSRGPPTSTTATSSIVFLDKGERWQTTQGIRKDLPLNDRPGLSDGKESLCPCGHSRLDITYILYVFFFNRLNKSESSKSIILRVTGKKMFYVLKKNQNILAATSS